MKPWPRTCVLIVAARAGEEIREHMEAVQVEQCRDCGNALHVDSATIRQAVSLEHRRGRPLEFVCKYCLKDYDPSNIDHHYDNRGGKATYVYRPFKKD